MQQESTRTSSPVEGDSELRDLFPELTRFYGLGFSELMAMPRWVLRLYAEAIIPLTAREQLNALDVSVYPHLKQEDATKIFNRNRDAAYGSIVAAEPPALMNPELFGIAVEYVGGGPSASPQNTLVPAPSDIDYWGDDD